MKYAIRTTPEQDRSLDLYLRLEQYFKQGFTSVKDDFFSTVETIVNELKTTWSDELILTRLSDIITQMQSYTIKTYESDIFAELNAKDYSIIRDGLIVVGGEANSGKSSFVSCLSLDIMKHNKNIALLFYTLDDSAIITGKRILSQIYDKNMFYESDIDAHNELLDRIVLRESIDINRIELEAQKVKELTHCDKVIIAIDYLQILPSAPNVIKREYLNDVLKTLKDIQKRLNCIMILVSQLNRDSKSTTYRYRETSEVENQADVCLDIIAEKSDSNERKIKVTKNKLGRKGRVWTTEICESFNFTKLTQDNEVKEVKTEKQNGKAGTFEYWTNV